MTGFYSLHRPLRQLDGRYRRPIRTGKWLTKAALGLVYDTANLEDAPNKLNYIGCCCVAESYAV